MREQIAWSFSTWDKYWGTGIHQYLLLFSVFYLLIRKCRKKSSDQTIPYVLLFLVLFFFPVSAAAIQKCIGQDVYWRVLWMLPATAVIALAATHLLSDLRKKLPRFSLRKPVLYSGLALLTTASVFLCGYNMLHSGNYSTVHNYQKVPDEVAQICNLIREHAEEETIKFVSDEHIISYMRVYDASIQMPYGRRGEGASGKTARRLYTSMSSFELDYERIAKLAKKIGINFIAISLTDSSAPALMAKHGYIQIGTVSSYGVFQLTE